MKSADEINLIMAEVGPLDDGIQAVARIADDQWTVRFEGDDVAVELDATGRRLVLSADIGSPPPGRAAAVYETLLSYAALWRETGGVRVALDQPGGQLMQMADLLADEATPAAVVTMAANLVERAAIWRTYVTDAADGPAGPGAPLDLTMSSFIRV